MLARTDYKEVPQDAQAPLSRTTSAFVGGRQFEFFRSDRQDARFGRSGPCFVAAISSGIPRRTTPCQGAPLKDAS